MRCSNFKPINQPSKEENILSTHQSEKEGKTDIGRKQKPKKTLKLANNKRIAHKNLSPLFQKWKIEMPFKNNQIFNVCNFISINKMSIIDSDFDESFISTKFYTNKLQKITILPNALLFNFFHSRQNQLPINYICESLNSEGDQKFHQLAERLKFIETFLPAAPQKIFESHAKQQETAVRFAQKMKNRVYISQVSPNFFLMSKSLLQLLDLQVQSFILQCLKFKSITLEFFSSQHYFDVINKHLQNFSLMENYLKKQISVQEMIEQSSITYRDYIYTKQQKKIACQFKGSLSEELVPYIEINQRSKTKERMLLNQYSQQKKKDINIINFCEKQQQYCTLKNLTKISKNLLPEYQGHICGYCSLE